LLKLITTTMITKTTEVVAPGSIVCIRLWGVCIYRHRRNWPSDKIWVLGLPVYRSEVVR
jgi:hypothetical protein